MLTAHVGHAISGLNPLRGQNNVQGSCDMGALPEVYSGYQRVRDITTRKKFEAAWGAGLPQKPGLTLIEMLKASLKNELKAMYIMGENPVISDPDAKHTIKALKKLKLLVVQDIFMTETAQLADVVLPAASFAEKDGTFTNTDRRVQKIRKVLEPIGEARPDWMIICDLSKKMGYGMDYKAPYEIMEEIALLTPSYRGILHHRLDEGFGLQWPCTDVQHTGTPFLHRKNFTRGLGSFIPVHYIPPDEQPDKEYPFILTTGRNYFQYHTGTMTRRTATLEREQPECLVEINDEDAEVLGIRNREKIRVSSRRGSLEALANVSDKVISGIIFIPFHFMEASANFLTNPALDPHAKIPEYKVRQLRKEKELIGPMKGFQGDFVFKTVEQVHEISIEYPLTLSLPKEFIFPQVEEMFAYSGEKIHDLMECKKKIVFGARPCDISAINLIGRFYSGKTEPSYDSKNPNKKFQDSYYISRRKNTVFISLGCNNPEPTCFCNSLGTGPFLQSGFDVQLIDLGDRFFVQTGSQSGKNIIDPYQHLFENARRQDYDDQYEIILSTQTKFEKRISLEETRQKILNGKVRAPFGNGLQKDVLNVAAVYMNARYVRVLM
jgi:formylmethanofuran dehydrogenase subunit D